MEYTFELLYVDFAFKPRLKTCLGHQQTTSFSFGDAYTYLYEAQRLSMYVELSPDRIMHKHLEVCIITQEGLSIITQAHLVTG